MTDISCATWDTEEDKRMADEWAEKEAGNPDQMTPELRAEFEKVMPEVEKAIEEKMERFIESSERERYENLSSEAKQDEPMATHEEFQAEKEHAKEIGMNDEEWSFLPITAGFNEKEMKEVVDFLHTGKIPMECWNNEDKVWKVAYINRPGPAGGRILASTPVPAEHPSKPKSVVADTIKIFQNEKGERPTREERNLKIAHEIFHRNEPEFMEIMAYNSEKWGQACRAQLQKGPVSEYSVRDYDKRDVQFSPEFQSEHYKHWATDSPGLCKEMYNFFDQYFPKRTT